MLVTPIIRTSRHPHSCLGASGGVPTADEGLSLKWVFKTPRCPPWGYNVDKKVCVLLSYTVPDTVPHKEELTHVPLE